MSGAQNWRILVTNPVLDSTRELLEKLGHVEIAPAADAQTLKTAARDADVIIVRAPLPPDIFEHTPRLAGVVRHGVGLDFIPVEAATAKGILVANVPGGNSNSVAEYCAMQILNVLRRPDRAEQLMRQVGWAKARQGVVKGFELRGRTVGIIGFGAIGSRLANILRLGFQANVVVTTVGKPDMPAWARQLALDELVDEADIIVPCVPYTPDNHHLLSDALIRRMKKTAYVVNASRGAIIDEAALLDALRNERIAGAALDVFEKSPGPGDPMTQVEHLIMTPHMAGNTMDAHSEIGRQCASEAMRMLTGERPVNLANPQAWTASQARRRSIPRRHLPTAP